MISYLGLKKIDLIRALKHMVLKLWSDLSSSSYPTKQLRYKHIFQSNFRNGHIVQSALINT